jgi:hypothetical protein
MTSTRKIVLPSESFRLEEINMPDELAATLAGRLYLEAAKRMLSVGSESAVEISAIFLPE